MKQEEINDKSRRNFLKTATIASVATAACGSLACSCSSKKAGISEKVKLLSPDEEIVEIDSAYLNHQEHMAYYFQTGVKGGDCRKKICYGSGPGPLYKCPQGLGPFPAQPESKEGKFEGNPFTHDFERWGLYRRLVNAEPGLALGQPTIGWVVASLDVCAGFFKPGALDRVKDMPMLVATATEKAIVDPGVGARLAALLPKARHLPVKGASHEIFMETDERRATFWKAFDELCATAQV